MPHRTDSEAELADVLTRVYSTRAQVTALLVRAGLTPGNFYPEMAETVREAWPALLGSLRRAQLLDEVMHTVLADERVASIHSSIHEFLRASQAPAEVTIQVAPAAQRDAATVLLCRTVLKGVPNEARTLARKILDAIVRTRIPQAHLFDATRLAIEFHLLLAESVGPAALLELVRSPPPFDDDHTPSFRACVQKVLEGGLRFHHVTLPVDPHAFFTRARTRAPYWHDYFAAVSHTSGTKSLHLTTCCLVRAQGCITPQFLVAGLLTRFDGDWRRILGAYLDMTDEAHHAFGRLQASQWNAWLTRGPSIPVCTCGEWHGLCAIQLGYGAEDNSIPLLGEADGIPRSFDAESLLAGSGSPSLLIKLSGRLRWGPSFMRLGIPPEEAPRDDSSNDLRPSAFRLPAARAQRALYETGDESASSRSGLIFQAEERSQRPIEGPTYFSVCLWMMFLVVRRGGAVPQRLAGRFPPFPSSVVDRRGARLWRELLPIFVRANIADEAALRMYERSLADTVLCFLRQVWEQRHAVLPDAPDQLGFHFVAASDHSGCGHRLRVPATGSLLDELRRRLGTELDASFARSLLLPTPGEAPDGRSDALERFYSACKLPEIVADYCAHVDDLRLG
jgi:hypothetical protein